MYCGKCGAKAPENTRFCQSCGATLINSAPTEIEYDAEKTIITETRPYEEIAQDYPRAVEFTGIPEPATIKIPDIADVELKPGIPNVSSIPQPFPETIPDSFPNPTMTTGVNVTGISKNEINSIRYDATSFSEINDINKTGDIKESSLTVDNKQADNYNEYNSVGDNIKREFKKKNETELNSNSEINFSNDKEKTYFGKTAFVCCLLIIAILSVLCGVFGGLYVRSIEKKTLANSNVNGVIDIYEPNGR